VLAVLGLFGGTTVQIDALADAVWGGSPPRTAEHTLHNYVLRLRRLGLAITRDGDGYRLETPTDVDLLERAVTDQSCRAEVLSLVRGRPGQGLPDSDLVRPRCAAVAEAIEAMREDSAAAALAAAGDSAAAGQLVPVLRGLVDQAPYRERRWDLLIRALYRSGRQSEALDAFAQLQARLADDLGIDPSPELRRLQQAVLSQDPALGSRGDAQPQVLTGGGRALPGLATRLVGRGAELAALRNAVTASRLVTVMGPLGAGKTRLVMEAVRDVSTRVWFVPVEGLPALTSVAEAALAVVARTSRASDPAAGLTAALADAEAFLVFDGAEHRIGEVAQLAVALLAGCASLRIIATSRQSLHVHDEATVPIAALPAGERRELLVDRARLADPGFSLALTDLAAADRLCELVDGLPLGIELVARHLRLLSVSELSARVDADLDRWTSGAGEEAAGLVGAVAATVEGLPGDLREFLVGLSVPAAEADLDLVHQTAAPDASDDWVFDALATLVDRSLVQVRGGPAGVRYALLLSVRRYCLSLLDEAARRRVEHRYVAAVLTRLERCGAALSSPDRPGVLADLDADVPHLQAALATGMEIEPAWTLQVATALGDYWIARRPAEGMAWLQRLLVAAPTAGDDRARVLLQMGHLAYWLTDFDLGTRLLAEARDLLAASSDSLLLGRVLRRLGAIAAATDNVAEAGELLHESVAVLAGHDVEEAVSLLHLGSLLADESRASDALPMLVRARDALRAAGDPLREAHALAALTLAWWKSDDLVAARGAGERALRQFQQLGHRPSEGVVAYRLSAIVRASGEGAAAREYAALAMDVGAETGTRTTTALARLAMAQLDLDDGDSTAAADRIGRALEVLDIATDRWVLAEALEAAARLQLVRGRSPHPLLSAATALRELIGQPPSPSAAREIETLSRVQVADPAAELRGLAGPAELRAWAMDVCAASVVTRGDRIGRSSRA
jgi:predicted ATPase/DNA-binding SARP family transcriptional activator